MVQILFFIRICRLFQDAVCISGYTASTVRLLMCPNVLEDRRGNLGAILPKSSTYQDSRPRSGIISGIARIQL
jgi:hypothetical protein